MTNLFVWFTAVVAFLITSCQGSNVVVEKGHSTKIEWSFPKNVTSVSCKLLTPSTPVDLSTCDYVSNKCTDQMPSLYTGYIGSSPTSSNKVMGLNVLKARVNETHFQCIDNNDETSNVTELVVYAWAAKPTCQQTLTDTYVDYTCKTGNVYPGISSKLHRREVDFVNGDISNKSCSLGADGSGTDGDTSASCTFRVMMENMLLTSSVYVEMTPYGLNSSIVNRSAPVSSDITTTLSVPTVILTDCPSGPGVHGDSVPKGVTATCKCEIETQGFPPGFARWFSKNIHLGFENARDKSSTLSFKYDPTDPKKEYECWPITPLRTTVIIRTFTFKSSAPPGLITRLHPMVIILGALSSWIVSRFS